MPRSRALCDEDQDRSAPRVACRCRACFMARERALDPALIELLYPLQYGRWTGVDGPARGIIRRMVDCYLVGDIEQAALYPEIVRALGKHADELFAQALAAAARAPMGLAEAMGLVEHIDGDPANHDPGNLRMKP
jgi:hypothetical protein